MQMGGSDQWGNIVAGIDLIRKRGRWHRLRPHLAAPADRADGAKFGKSAGGAVWLDPDATSPYQFRQFFVQVDDADVERQLLWFTLLPVSRDRGGARWPTARRPSSGGPSGRWPTS